MKLVGAGLPGFVDIAASMPEFRSVREISRFPA